MSKSTFKNTTLQGAGVLCFRIFAYIYIIPLETTRFSSANRSVFLDQMATQTFDVLVIGGGITGAGIALDASARGLKVALVEKQDFGAGTSSRSTKLIHGGLRYLKQFEIGLVMEVGREREIVYRNAPHLVIPEKMLLPVIEKGSLGEFSTSIGLYVYDVLAGVKAGERRKMLSKEQTLKQEPLLRKSILKAGALYTEYRSDDARLVIENMKEAVKRGAVCLNYTLCQGFVYEQGKVKAARVIDQISGREVEVKASYIINAAGPWVDELREMDKSRQGKRLHLTKGVHIVFPFEKLPVHQAMYFDAPLGRMIFAIPRDGCTYVGTTDTNYTEQKERPAVTQEDVNYLLKAVNDIFEGVQVKESDIVSSWCGLRPLIHEDGKSPSELSRKDEIFESASGLLSIAGGKLTGYRKMSQRIVDKIFARISEMQGKAFVACSTDKIPLAGGFESRMAVEQFTERLFGEAKQVNFSREQVAKLVGKYGKNAQTIVELAYELRKEVEDADTLLTLAELQYGMAEEMVCTPSDFFIRRSGMLYFNRLGIIKHREAVLQRMEALSSVGSAFLQASKSELQTELDDVMHFA